MQILKIHIQYGMTFSCHIPLLKERVHSEMKTFDRLDYCPYIQTITFIISKSAPTFSGRVSVSKICTSGDLHHTIRGPASHHPRTCITPSEALHHTIRGPESHHLRTCITPSEDLHHTIRGPASQHPDLHQAIQGPASHHPRICIRQ